VHSSSHSRHFARNSHDAFERERLALLTQVADPITVRRLAELGVEPGWRCLEVGAGDGSVAHWLADQVGPEGQVVATDINPRFLGGQGRANLTIRRYDLLEDELEPGHYDLVHCRFVLAHLPDPLRGLGRLVEAVRPGGWLLVEEFDAASFGAADVGHPRAAEFDRRTRILWTVLHAAGPIDTTFGRRLPVLIERLDFQQLAHDGVTLTGRGGDAMAQFTRMTDDLLRERFVTTGLLSDADFDELERDYNDPSFWFVGFTVFGVRGRRPSQAVALRQPPLLSASGACIDPFTCPGGLDERND
jgi:SAM-dependent methyltransferase